MDAAMAAVPSDAQAQFQAMQQQIADQEVQLATVLAEFNAAQAAGAAANQQLNNHSLLTSS